MITHHKVKLWILNRHGLTYLWNLLGCILTKTQRQILFLVFVVTSLNLKAQSLQRVPTSSDTLYQVFVDEFLRRDNTIGSVVQLPNRTVIKGPAIISERSFDTLYKPIFSKVMLSNDNLISQGSAYSFEVDQIKSTFSLNYNWLARKQNAKCGYLNAGFSATSSSKTLPIFSKDQWQQGFSGTFGYTKDFAPFKKSDPLAFKLSDPEDFFIKRKITEVAILKRLNYLLNNSSSITAELLNQKNSLSKIIIPSGGSIADLSVINIRDYERLQSQCDSITKLNKIDTLLRDLDTSGVRNYVITALSDFELSYFKSTSFDYSFFWFNILVRPEYKGVAIYDTTAARKIGIDKKDYFRIGIEGNVNYASSKKNLFILQIGLSIGNTNSLEGKQAQDIQLVNDTLPPIADLKSNGEGVIINNYELYKKKFALINPSIGFNWFFGRSRTFGIESFISSKLGLKSKVVPFDNLFSYRIGGLISAKGKSDLGKSTIGLIFQWQDAKIDKYRFKDNFSFSIRIGVPFNI